jgi:SAM-dependent methyltransferase
VNVVDHGRNPGGVVAEIHRVLKPGGVLVFGVNTLSVLGEVKWRMWKAFRPKEWLFVAHPHTFTWRRAERMLRGAMARSRVLWRNEPGVFGRAAGHGRMSFWILEKGDGPWS